MSDDHQHEYQFQQFWRRVSDVDGTRWHWVQRCVCRDERVGNPEVIGPFDASDRLTALVAACRTLVESQEFYELMQAYRCAPIMKPAEVLAAFDAVKAALLARAEGGVRRPPEEETKDEASRVAPGATTQRTGSIASSDEGCQ